MNSPIPWYKKQLGSKGLLFDIIDAKGDIVTTVESSNADDIIIAINAHNRLVEACESAEKLLATIIDAGVLNPGTVNSYGEVDVHVQICHALQWTKK